MRHGMPIQSAGIASPDSRCPFSGCCRLALGGSVLEEPTILRQSEPHLVRPRNLLFVLRGFLAQATAFLSVVGNGACGQGLNYGGIELQREFFQISLCRCIYRRTPWEPARIRQSRCSLESSHKDQYTRHSSGLRNTVITQKMTE